MNALDIAKELSANKQLIKLTTGRENGESSGSDSEPSADNLDQEEMEKIVPVEKKKAKPATTKQLLPPKKIETTKPQSPMAKPKVVKEITRSPTKKASGNYNPFDRLSLRKRKPEMKDAWTQTTPRARDERRARRQREQKERELLQKQVQAQSGHPVPTAKSSQNIFEQKTKVSANNFQKPSKSDMHNNVSE